MWRRKTLCPDRENKGDVIILKQLSLTPSWKCHLKSIHGRQCDGVTKPGCLYWVSIPALVIALENLLNQSELWLCHVKLGWQNNLYHENDGMVLWEWANSYERFGLSLVSQSCLSLCDPMNPSPPSSSVCGDSTGKHTILQGIFPTQGSNPGLPHCRSILYCLSHQRSPRILEWVA